MNDKYLSYFERGFVLEMSSVWAFTCSQPGQDAEPFVDMLLDMPEYRAQIEHIDPESLLAELVSTVAWEEHELTDREENLKKITRIAACNIREEIQEERRNRGAN